MITRPPMSMLLAKLPIFPLICLGDKSTRLNGCGFPRDRLLDLTYILARGPQFHFLFHNRDRSVPGSIWAIQKNRKITYWINWQKSTYTSCETSQAGGKGQFRRTAPITWPAVTRPWCYQSHTQAIGKYLSSQGGPKTRKKATSRLIIWMECSMKRSMAVIHYKGLTVCYCQLGTMQMHAQEKSGSIEHN